MARLFEFFGAAVFVLSFATGIGWLASNLTIKDRTDNRRGKKGEKK